MKVSSGVRDVPLAIADETHHYGRTKHCHGASSLLPRQLLSSSSLMPPIRNVVHLVLNGDGNIYVSVP